MRLRHCRELPYLLSTSSVERACRALLLLLLLSPRALFAIAWQRRASRAVRCRARRQAYIHYRRRAAAILPQHGSSGRQRPASALFLAGVAGGRLRQQRWRRGGSWWLVILKLVGGGRSRTGTLYRPDHTHTRTAGCRPALTAAALPR